MTEYVDFEGKVAWARLYEPDNAFGASKWKLELYPKDDNEIDRIKKSGIQKKFKENNDPEKGPIGKHISFDRNAFKVIKGEMVNFTGPIVMNHEGHVIVDYINKDTKKRVYSYKNSEKGNVLRRGEPVIIGNGSDVKVRVAIYDTLKGKGQRLESVTVLNLVEFKQEDRPLPPVVKDVTKPIGEFDKPILPGINTTKNDLDDEIPF